MLRMIFCSVVALTAVCAVAADSGQTEIQAAAKKLADAPNYSWSTTTHFGNNDRTTEGKTEKNGYTMLTLPGPNNSTREVVIFGNAFAINGDNGWQSEKDLTQDDGSGQPNRSRFLANMIKRLKNPAAQLTDLSGKVKELKKNGDTYEGELTEEAAKEALTFRGGRRGNANGNAAAQNNGPQVSNAKGDVKVMLKDGMISKFQLHVSGTVTGRNGNEREVDRTSETTISNVGTTKVDVPAEAKKKLPSPG